MHSQYMNFYYIIISFVSRHQKFSVSFTASDVRSQFQMEPPLLSNTFLTHPRMESAHLLNQKQLKVFSIRSVILEPPIRHLITMCQTCLPYFVIAEYTLCVCVCYGRRLKLRNVTLSPGDSNTIDKRRESHCPTHGVIVFCVTGISLGTFVVRFF